MINTCPPGMICLDNNNLLIIFILLAVIFFMFSKNHSINLENSNNKILDQKLKILEEKQHNLDTKIDESKSPNTDLVVVNKDRELMTDPLLPPHRRNYYIEGPNYVTKGVPINIQTRGYDGGYQQLGMLYRDDIEDKEKQIGNNTETNILPLFGKPMYSNSSKWMYYTSSDKFNNVKIPISYKGRDCSDDYGCDELYNDDQINIPAYNGNFKVKIYKFDKPRYIPYL